MGLLGSQDLLDQKWENDKSYICNHRNYFFFVICLLSVFLLKIYPTGSYTGQPIIKSYSYYCTPWSCILGWTWGPRPTGHARTTRTVCLRSKGKMNWNVSFNATLLLPVLRVTLLFTFQGDLGPAGPPGPVGETGHGLPGPKVLSHSNQDLVYLTTVQCIIQFYVILPGRPWSNWFTWTIRSKGWWFPWTSGESLNDLLKTLHVYTVS